MWNLLGSLLFSGKVEPMWERKLLRKQKVKALKDYAGKKSSPISWGCHTITCFHLIGAKTSHEQRKRSKQWLHSCQSCQNPTKRHWQWNQRLNCNRRMETLIKCFSIRTESVWLLTMKLRNPSRRETQWDWSVFKQLGFTPWYRTNLTADGIRDCFQSWSWRWLKQIASLRLWLSFCSPMLGVNMLWAVIGFLFLFSLTSFQHLRVVAVLYSRESPKSSFFLF